MDCDGYEAILTSAAGAAALGPALEAHRRDCPACARRRPDEVRLVVAVTASLEAALSVEPSADFLARVRSQVDDERARASAGGRRWPWAVAASVVIATVWAGVGGLQRRPATVGEATLASTPTPRVDVTDPPRADASRPLAPPEARPPQRQTGRPPTPAVRASVHFDDVIVEPGQAEALARLAAGALPGRPRSAFAVASLDAEVPLPRLQPGDLPRFEMKPIELRPTDWGPAGDAEDSELDINEGSDS
jgi:hypothetical protein